MPNLVTNKVCISGPEETLTKFMEENLDFVKFHPRPLDVDWYDWNVTHWGTKWAPDIYNIRKSSDAKSIVMCFDSAWSPPIAFFAYLTERFDGVHVIDNFVDESYCFVGCSDISGGTAKTVDFEPSDYTFESLRKFSRGNPWYNNSEYEKMIHSLNECSDSGSCNCLSELSGTDSGDVIPNMRTETYKEITERVSRELQAIVEK